jgi:hypothetical protein
MKFKSILLSLAGLLLLAACNNNKQVEAPESTLEVAAPTIEAAAETNTYTIDVTSNIKWRAEVGADAEWCTIVASSGDGNGTVTVSVETNNSIEPRKAVVTISPVSEEETSLSKEVTINQTGIVAPSVAKTDKIWIVGEGETLQLWSDAILLPRCDKEDFDGGDPYANNPFADCRSSEGGEVSLFSGPFVIENAAEICPEGWRVPTLQEFMMLDINLGGTGAREQYFGSENDKNKPLERYNGPEWGGEMYGIYHLISGFVYRTDGFYRGIYEAGQPDVVLNYYDIWVGIDSWGDTKSETWGLPVRCIRTL